MGVKYKVDVWTLEIVDRDVYNLTMAASEVIMDLVSDKKRREEWYVEVFLWQLLPGDKVVNHYQVVGPFGGLTEARRWMRSFYGAICRDHENMIGVAELVRGDRALCPVTGAREPVGGAAAFLSSLT